MTSWENKLNHNKIPMVWRFKCTDNLLVPLYLTRQEWFTSDDMTQNLTPYTRGISQRSQREKEISYKELAHAIAGAEKFQDRPSAKLETQESQHIVWV